MRGFIKVITLILFINLWVFVPANTEAKTSDVLEFLSAIAEGMDQKEKSIQQEQLLKAKKMQQQKLQEDFNNKVAEIIKKLPSSARMVVPEIAIQVPELDESLNDEEVREARVKFNKSLHSFADEARLGLEAQLENLGVKLVERDAFKEIEREISYSQTGEIDPASSAKFGKAFGATHMILTKLILKGMESAQPTLTLSLRVIEIESMLRVGSAISTLELDVPANAKTNPIPKLLVDESFSLQPGTYKDYNWQIQGNGKFDIRLAANSDVHVYVVDFLNYMKYLRGEGFYGIIKNSVTSTSFSTNVERGKSYYIVISNKHSLFTNAGVHLNVSYTLSN